LRFSRKRQDESAPKFFTGFNTKHLFNTTCIENQCTQPLKCGKHRTEINHYEYTDQLENVAQCTFNEKKSMQNL